MVLVYNDYYLQEISGKLTIINNKLDDVIDSQAISISGDKIINDSITDNTQLMLGSAVYFIILLFALLFYGYFKGIFKGR